ncbi:MAG: septum formation family protein [Acidimicrobiia bacterium]|nr:septum formation family protein [Acidimicrobiia bacterium]
MRGNARILLVVAAGLFLVGCTRTTSDSTPDVSAPPPTAGATTTTSMVSDLGLVYAFEPNLMMDFDLHEELIELITIEGDPAVVRQVIDPLDVFDGALEVTMDGTSTILLVDGPAGGYEVVRSRQVEVADANGIDLDSDIRRSLSGIDTVPSVVDLDGRVSTTGQGAPAPFLGHPSASPLPLLGPVLPEAELVEGLAWSFTHQAAVEVAVEATVLSIDGEDQGLVATIGLEAAIGRIEFDPSAGSSLWPGAEGLATSLGAHPGWRAAQRDDLEVVAETSPSSASGTYRIRMSDGTLLSSSVVWEVVQTVRFTMQADSGPATAAITSEILVTTDQTLSGRQVVSQSQARRILRDFERDAFEVAQGVAEVPGLLADNVTEEQIDLLVSIVLADETLFAGFGTSLLSGPTDETVAVLTATLAPQAGGEPYLAEVFVAFLLDVPYDLIEVDRQQVVSFQWRDRPVFAWSNNTHLVILVGSEPDVRIVIGSMVKAFGVGEQWSAGDCIDAVESGAIPFAPFGSTQTVHCKAEHSHEVIASVPLPEGPDAPFPDDLSARVSRTCGEAFVERYGRLAPDSTLGLIRYLPDANEWEEGDRYIACVVYLPEAGGAAGRLYDRLVGGPDAFAFEPQVGDCLATFTEVGPCDRRHAFEVVGLARFDEAPDAPYPGVEAVEEYFDDACATILDDYGVGDGEGVVESSAFLEVFEWEQGSRTAPCRAYVLIDIDGAEGRFQADVRGSIRSGWTVVGEETSS